MLLTRLTASRARLHPPPTSDITPPADQITRLRLVSSLARKECPPYASRCRRSLRARHVDRRLARPWPTQGVRLNLILIDVSYSFTQCPTSLLVSSSGRRRTISSRWHLTVSFQTLVADILFIYAFCFLSHFFLSFNVSPCFPRCVAIVFIDGR